MRELILGGARSGKSRLAEERAIASGKQPVYVATAEPGDSEMEARIQAHRERRGDHWQVVEEPRKLAEVLSEQAQPGRCLLVDCLTLWLSNLLPQPERWRQERAALVALLPTLPGHIILVSNEVGTGVVPMGELTRRFVDESGWLHQDLAKICDRVTFTVAGLSYPLKDITAKEANS